MNAVSFRNVSKTFHRHARHMLLRQRAVDFFTRQVSPPFYALQDVSFDLPEGEGLGVIGANGSGKSTLLGLLSGMALPSSGSVDVRGRLVPLLELGSGFHPDLTGAENIYMNASLLGFGEKQVTRMFDEIVAFSGIGDFIEEPLRTYSSGMVVRLAFSVAVNVDPEILVIDEVLAVGDAAFQAKCFERVRALRRSGKTFVCVSHSRQLLQNVCDSALWLDHGRVMMHGRFDEVFDAYMGKRAVAGAAGRQDGA